MSIADHIERELTRGEIGLDRVFIGSGARRRLEEVVPEGASIAVLMDREMYRAGDEDVKREVIASLRMTHQVSVVELDGDVHADEKTVAQAADGCREADVVVTIGSGTLCDIGKVVAVGRMHLVLQSAASVNGYADDQSVLLVNGVKRTVHSAWPTALLVDTDVLVDAPVALNRSGMGDMISMFTAPADWYLSSIFGMDRGYSHEIATTTRRYGDDLLSWAEGIATKEPVKLASLAEMLTLSGLSMGAAGQTAPSSGMEHTVSHLLDMAHGARGEANAWHGEQVGVSTVLVSLLWQRMLERLESGRLPAMTLPAPEEAEAQVRRAFTPLDPSGKLANECWADYSLKLAHLAKVDAPSLLREAAQDWSVHARQLEQLLVEPERIVAAQRASNAPTRFSTLRGASDPETVVWALSSCHLMRNRLTIADVAWLTGCWNEEDVVAVVAAADALGAGV